MKAEEYLNGIAIVLGEDEDGNDVYLDHNEDAYKQVLRAMKAFAASQTEEMQKDVNFLRCLEAAGVNNWEGYDIAQDIRDGVEY